MVNTLAPVRPLPAAPHVVACLLAVCLLCFPGLTRADVPPRQHAVSFYVQWHPQSQFAGLFMARAKGFFEKRNLAVKFIWAKSGDNPLLALARGEVEFAGGWLATALSLRAEGHPLVNILQLHQRSASLVVTKPTIRDPHELDGKTMLSWGGDFKVELDLFLKRVHAQPARVLPQSLSMAPFINGLVDGAQAMEYNELHRLKERGMRAEDLRVYRLDDYGVNFIGDGIYTTEDYLRNNPGVVKAMREAILEGWEYALSHEEESVALIMEYAENKNLRTNTTHQRYMLDVSSKLITAQGWADPRTRGLLRRKNFEEAKNLLIEAGYPLQNLTLEAFHAHPAMTEQP